MAKLIPNGMQTFLDDNGSPLSAGHVFMYVPSTTTDKTTWQDAGETILNVNPILLDSAGRALIYGNGTYRQIVKDSDDNVIWDQLTAVFDSEAALWAATSTGTGNSIVGTLADTEPVIVSSHPVGGTTVIFV